MAGGNQISEGGKQLFSGVCKELFPEQFTGQLCYAEDSIRTTDRVAPYIIPLLVMLTGTRQKIVTVDQIVHQEDSELAVGSIVSYDSIEVEEAGYRHGGEIARDKLIGWMSLFWEKYGGYGRSETCFGGGQCFNPMIFLSSDVKVSLGAAGEIMQPHHKLRREIPGKVTSLSEFLPEYLTETYQRELRGKDLVVRWSTGNAALKILNRDGDYAIVYGQSEASISLPNWLVTEARFWKEYVKYGMEKRGGSLEAHLGSPMGILIEDIYEMVKNPKIMKRIWSDIEQRIEKDYLSDEEMQLLIPGCPDGMSRMQYLVNHAKGAADNVVKAVLTRITQLTSPAEILIGEHEME